MREVAADRRILGVDPGSQRTGYGIVDVRGNRIAPVAWGVLRTRPADPFPDRVFRIHGQLVELIRAFRPTEASVEKVFLAKNPSSALKLGQVRGAVLVACRVHGLAVHEYSAKEIKAAATGFGGAPKEQVGTMVGRLLGIRERIPPDASDALAMAFCRAVHRDPRGPTPGDGG